MAFDGEDATIEQQLAALQQQLERERERVPRSCREGSRGEGC